MITQERIDKAIDRAKLASELSLAHYHKPIIVTYSGGKGLKLIADKKYMVQVKSDFAGKTLNYECYDCPKCGCQNVMQVREV